MDRPVLRSLETSPKFSSVMSLHRNTKTGHEVRSSESEGSVMCTNNNNASISSLGSPCMKKRHRSLSTSLGDINCETCAFSGKDTPRFATEIKSAQSEGNSSSIVNKKSEQIPRNDSAFNGNASSVSFQETAEAANNESADAQVGNSSSINRKSEQMFTLPRNASTVNGKASTASFQETAEAANNESADEQVEEKFRCTNNNAFSSTDSRTTTVVDRMATCAVVVPLSAVKSKTQGIHAIFTVSSNRPRLSDRPILEESFEVSGNYSDLSLAEKVGRREASKKHGYGVRVPLPGGPKPNDIIHYMMGVVSDQLTRSYAPHVVYTPPAPVVLDTSPSSHEPPNSTKRNQKTNKFGNSTSLMTMSRSLAGKRNPKVLVRIS